jgi:methyltransferase-like protein
LYKSVKERISNPQEISKVVSKYFEKKNLSQSFINSLQAGAMARLVEMRLIRIEKHGIYSSYRVESRNPDLDNLLSASISAN